MGESLAFQQSQPQRLLQLGASQVESTLRQSLPCYSAFSSQRLYRPVGPGQFAWIRQQHWRAFPKRRPQEKFFYPLLSLEFARQIALDWQVPNSGVAYILAFEVDAIFLHDFEPFCMGQKHQQEYRIPAQRLEELNQSLMAPIDWIETLYQSPELSSSFIFHA